MLYLLKCVISAVNSCLNVVHCRWRTAPARATSDDTIPRTLVGNVRCANTCATTNALDSLALTFP